MIDYSLINAGWTLFLDRDGVINPEKKDDYILNVSEFGFYEGVPAAMKTFAGRFGLILLVTNQRGIGKGLMTEADLRGIHDFMLEEIVREGGRLDRIYYCSAFEKDHSHRKPNTGMALQAKADFPGIDFSRSIIAGNKLSDMQFGRNAGMKTVYIATTNPEVSFPHELIDDRFDSLPSFAHAVSTGSIKS